MRRGGTPQGTRARRVRRGIWASGAGSWVVSYYQFRSPCQNLDRGHWNLLDRWRMRPRRMFVEGWTERGIRMWTGLAAWESVPV